MVYSEGTPIIDPVILSVTLGAFLVLLLIFCKLYMLYMKCDKLATSVDSSSNPRPLTVSETVVVDLPPSYDNLGISSGIFTDFTRMPFDNMNPKLLPPSYVVITEEIDSNGKTEFV